MDTFKDFLSELKSRASNPLIVSFVISWLFCNYQIPVTLLFYKQSELSLDRYTSYLGVIQANTNFIYNFFIPLVLAIAYTLTMPFVKGFIRYLQAWVNADNDTRILEATNAGSMPISRFNKLREELKIERASLKELITTESATVDTLRALQSEYDKLELQNKTLSADAETSIKGQQQDLLQIQDLESKNAKLGLDLNDAISHAEKAELKIAKWNACNDSSTMNGTWLVKRITVIPTDHQDVERTHQSEEPFTLSFNNGTVASSLVDDEGQIYNIAGNLNENSVAFIIEYRSEHKQHRKETYFIKLAHARPLVLEGFLDGIHHVRFELQES